MNKSSMVFSSNSREEIKQELGSLSGMDLGSRPRKYLSHPSERGRPKVQALEFVKEKISKNSLKLGSFDSFPDREGNND